MRERIPEAHKIPGICYAWTDDGLELPVVDITHPAFMEEASAAEIDGIIARTMEMMANAMRLPPESLAAMREQSILMRVMTEAADTVMSGMATYLYKLGPANLGEGYASAVDRAIAAGITPLSMRLRMRHLARLLAGGVLPALSRRQGPLVFLNIAGGPAVDTLNALILLWREHRALLSGPAPGGTSARQVSIHVLDLDTAGPRFGARALDALMAEGGPLHGLAATFHHVPYDWADVTTLRQLLAEVAAPDAVLAGSSEGGLFEYPEDGQIVENLSVLHDGTPDDFVMAGTVVRDTTTIDPRLAPMEAMRGRPAIRFIGVKRFAELACRAGWAIAAVEDEAIHHVVQLRRQHPPAAGS